MSGEYGAVGSGNNESMVNNRFEDRDAFRSEKMDPDLDIIVRHGFVRKVFAIVGFQLLATMLIASPFAIYQDSIKGSLGSGGLIALIIIASVVTIGVQCYMSCKPEVGRKYPTNYILLSVLTVGMSLLVGYITLAYTTASVVMVIGITAGLTFVLMLFAIQTKYDFTGFGPYLFIALVVFTIFGFCCIFISSHIVLMARAGLGVLMFSMYLIYHTQVIVGGKHRQYQISVDDYVFAALLLYLDIMNLFIYLLELFGARN